MVKHDHPERTVWMVPGGGIEEGESSAQAAAREVLEETGLEVEITGLIWHVEEVSERGQRFVNFFRAKVTGGELGLGSDPELAENGQVLTDIRFMTREEVAELENLYPEFLTAARTSRSWCPPRYARSWLMPPFHLVRHHYTIDGCSFQGRKTLCNATRTMLQ